MLIRHESKSLDVGGHFLYCLAHYAFCGVAREGGDGVQEPQFKHKTCHEIYVAGVASNHSGVGVLFEGADNNVLGQYSADTCLQKSGAESRLDGDLSAEEHEAIGKLIRAALEPGPCPGVTDVDILSKFLVKGKEFPVDLNLRQMIFDNLED